MSTSLERAILMMALGTSCGLPERAWVDLPGDEKAKTILFAVRDPTLRVFAYPIDRTQAINLPALVADGDEIEAVVFNRELDFEPGELAMGAGGTVADLPGLAAVYSAARHGEKFDSWVLEETISAELGTFPVAPVGASKCGPLTGKNFPLPTSERAMFALPLGDAVLIGSDDRRVFRVFEDRFEEVAHDPSIRLRSAAMDEMGRLWFASTTTRTFTLWSGALGESLVLEPIATSTGEVIRMAVANTDPLELVAIARDGNWYAYDEQAGVREIRPADPTFNSRIVDMEALGPRNVLATHSGFGDIIRYRDGRFTTEAVAAPTRFRGVGYVEGIGPIVTTYLNHVWFYQSDAWFLLGSATVTLPTDIVPTATGFLLGSELGAVEEYMIDVGFCPDYAFPSQGEETVLGAPLNGGAMFVSSYERSSELLVTFVRRE